MNKYTARYMKVEHYYAENIIHALRAKEAWTNADKASDDAGIDWKLDNVFSELQDIELTEGVEPTESKTFPFTVLLAYDPSLEGHNVGDIHTAHVTCVHADDAEQCARNQLALLLPPSTAQQEIAQSMTLIAIYDGHLESIY